ncbi:MAG: response regulator transcription factor [Pseudomonadota bacterium]
MAAHSPTILVVDDEPHIIDVVRYAPEQDGFRVLTARHGSDALAIFRRETVDLIVLDILMPELDGLSLCRQLRADSAVPIIFLSSRTEEVDRILGLELGGDDYLTKPFSPRELAARVRTVLRRSAGRGVAEGSDVALSHGAIEMDVARHEVRVAGARVDLTVTEFGVLRSLIERPGRVLTRSQLIESTYLHDNHVTERTIDTHIRRLRAKLRPFGVDPIETVHGLGYRASESNCKGE